MSFLIKNITKTNLLTVSASVSLLIIALSVAYHLVIFLPSKHQAELKLTEQESIKADIDQSQSDNIEQQLKAYNLQKKEERNTVASECMNELAERYRNGEFVKEGTEADTTEKAKAFIDLYMDVCLTTKGYKE